MQVRLFLDYLQNVKRYSSHTITAYRDDLMQFLRFFNLSEDENDFSGVTAKMVREWLVEEMQGNLRKDSPGKKIEATSGRRKLSSIKAFFRFLVKQGLLAIDPTVGIGGPKIPKRLPIFVTEEQLSLYLDGAEGGDFSTFRDRLIFLMLYETGMRRSELVGLEIEDLDFGRRSVRVRGKGGKQREIPLMEELLEDAELYLELRKEIVSGEHKKFFVTDKGNPIYDKFVYRLVTRILGRVTTLSKCSPHVLRHTFATHLLNNGASIQGIRELLGHTSLAATQIYTHNSVESMLNVFKQAHPRP